jgi:hypothetical protein
MALGSILCSGITNSILFQIGDNMYQGNGHIWQGRFNCISDFMHRYQPEGPRPGGRPSEEYRHARRNTARLSYRMAKKALKAGLVKDA